MLYRERDRIVRSLPHGWSLAIFWQLNVIWYGLEILSWRNTKWWWHLESHVDVADFALYIVRCALLGGVIFFGILRPLCCRRQHTGYSLLVNVDEGDEEVSRERQQRKEGSFVKKRSSSAFADIWKKAILLFPYIWPKRKLYCCNRHLFRLQN